MLEIDLSTGKLVKRDVFYPRGTGKASDRELMSAVLNQYYADAAAIPSEVILGEEVEGAASASRFLASRRGSSVKVIVPGRGKKLELVKMAAENARLLLERRVLSSEGAAASALLELKKKLKLRSLPIRIVRSFVVDF